MKNVMEKFLSFPPVFGVASLLTYAFYSIPIGISLLPSACIIYFSVEWLIAGFSFLKLSVFCLLISFSVFIFFIFACIIFGITSRLITFGIKPGRYIIGSPTFIRWLINGGLHTIALNLILPFIVGSDWIKIYFKLAGCKMGKNVFLNSPALQDAYLLELGNDVIIGGRADITCHMFEGRHLILDKIIIGDNTLIGFRSYVMPGVHVGKKCSIGCYSIVRKDREFNDHSTVVSIPGLPIRNIAKFIRDIDKKSV